MNSISTQQFIDERKAQGRASAQFNLVVALRAFPPEQRASEAETAIASLAKQEAREAKLRALAALSDDDLDKIDIS
jgi:DNA-directed RNA polymerase specialized sigma24 family protein